MSQSAPPRLVYACERPPWAVVVCLLAVALLGFAVLLRWTMLGAQLGAAAAGWLLWGLALALALHCWWRWPCGELEWDGARWWLRMCSSALSLPLLETPQLHWDGQEHFLLSVTLPGHGRCWLWLQSGTAPLRWAELRRAVYCRSDESA